jgi:hypothetical protein
MATHHADWPKTLEWIEKHAQESLKARFQTAEILAKESQTTLTVLLAAIGASAAYAAKIFQPGAAGPIEIAAAVTCVYLVMLAVTLVAACMIFVSYPALHQDPLNLMQPTYSIDEIREAEITNLQERIAEAAAINKKRARRLNRLRIATALSPFFFALVAAIAPIKAPAEADPSKIACRITPAASEKTTARIDCELTR